MKEKIIYFVTLVIKYTEVKAINGSNLTMKNQRITIYQKIQQKSKNSTDAYNQTMVEAQSKYGNVQLIAHTTTELTKNLFEDDMGLENGKVVKLNSDENKKETSHATESNDMEGQEQ